MYFSFSGLVHNIFISCRHLTLKCMTRSDKKWIRTWLTLLSSRYPFLTNFDCRKLTSKFFILPKLKQNKLSESGALPGQTSSTGNTSDSGLRDHEFESRAERSVQGRNGTAESPNPVWLNKKKKKKIWSPV